MSARSTGRRFVVLVVLAVTCVGAIAFAAARHKTAPHPRPLKYACASTRFKTRGVLQCVARPSACRGRGRKLIAFVAGRPVYTCRKNHGHHRTRPRSVLFHAAPIRHHGPAGLMRRVARFSACAPPSQPNETPMVLPAKKRTYFCAARRGRELRWAGG